MVINKYLNFNYWKNNTTWWGNYVQLNITEDFIEYAVGSPDYKTRVATAQFFAYQVYLPEIEKFKTVGQGIIKKIDVLTEEWFLWWKRHPSLDNFHRLFPIPPHNRLQKIILIAPTYWYLVAML